MELYLFIPFLAKSGKFSIEEFPALGAYEMRFLHVYTSPNLTGDTLLESL